MGQTRTIVEGWPALMSLEMASRYLAMEESQFEKVCARFNAHPVELELGLLRWRRSDLDSLIKRLSAVPVVAASAGASRLARLEDADVERIAEAVAVKIGGTIPSVQRSLVSIKEAGIILGLARTTIYRLINDGRLNTRQIGRRTLIPASEIQAILDGAPPSE